MIYRTAFGKSGRSNAAQSQKDYEVAAKADHRINTIDPARSRNSPTER
jgi:hypothetical protein